MINLFSRKLKTILIILMCFNSLFTATAQTICSSETGSQGGYTYELWTEGSGSVCMTLGSGGSFSVEWSNAGNFVARKGNRPGEYNSTVSYSCNYNPNGNSYLGVYGWTTDPLIEYYIVDGWGDWRPPGASSKGTVNIDGGTYDIYETTRTNQPSIIGTATFQQYWSVRTSKKTSGSINCGAHFDEWANRGMNLGNFYEVSFHVEGYQSSGSANVTSMSITTGGTTQTPQPGTLGDVNADGTINIVDALLTAQYYVDLNPANFNPDVADTNCDGNINIVDALLIAQYYVGLINSFC
jgi:endo-1,4-beta-xylanase